MMRTKKLKSRSPKRVASVSTQRSASRPMGSSASMSIRNSGWAAGTCSWHLQTLSEVVELRTSLQVGGSSSLEAALTATSFEIGTRSINLVDRFGVYQKFLVGVLLPPSLKVSNNNLHG